MEFRLRSNPWHYLGMKTKMKKAKSSASRESPGRIDPMYPKTSVDGVESDDEASINLLRWGLLIEIANLRMSCYIVKCVFILQHYSRV